MSFIESPPTDPRISVLIPVYQRAEIIGHTIRSVLASGYERLEVIVSDNGSTDGTADAVAVVAMGDSRVRLIRHANNRGPLANWRSCLDAATGDLVHWLWSDDWIEPGFYRTLVDGMRATGAEMACSAASVVDPVARTSYTVGVVAEARRSMMDLVRMYWRAPHLPFSPAAYLLPREACHASFFSEIPLAAGIDCNRRAMGCDLLMILGSIQKSGTMFIHAQPLVNFRHHPGSISVSSAASILSSHYAWARLWWAKRHMRVGASLFLDYARLIRWGYLRAAWKALLGY